MRTLKIIFLLALLVSFYACKQVVDAAQNWTTADESTKVEGKYHTLEDDNLRIFLPKGFERKSIQQYSEAIDSIATDKKAKNQMIKNLQATKDMSKGNFYLFYNAEFMSEYYLMTTPYFDFNRQDAKSILGMITQVHNVPTNVTTNFEKIHASFRATDDVKIFKAIYKVHNVEVNKFFYKSYYVLSTSTKKTMQIVLTTPFEVDFDPFIAKTKI